MHGVVINSMGAERLEKWVDTSGSGPEALLHHRFLKPPYGYAIGVLLWPVFISITSLWVVLLQSNPPSIVSTVGGLIIVGGGFMITSISSALVMGATAWNTPDERIRRQFTLFCLSLILAVLLFGLHLNPSLISYRSALGLSAFAAYELSKIVFLGPAIGFAFVIFSLVVLVYRSHLK